MHNNTVLLVDDEKPILKSLGNYLQKNAFYLKPPINGEDALAEFHSFSFDLVITDLVMSGVSGIPIKCQTGLQLLSLPCARHEKSARQTGWTVSMKATSPVKVGTIPIARAVAQN